MLRVMVISPYYPSFQRSGSAARLATMLNYFRARGCNVRLVFAFRKARHCARPADLFEFIDDLTFFDLAGSRVSGVQSLHLQKVLAPRGSRIGRLRQKAEHLLTDGRDAAKVVARLVARHRPDVLWVDHTFLAPLVSKVPRGAAVRIVDTHDVMHLRDASLRAGGLPADSGVTRTQEQELLRAFDLVVAIQDEERRELEAMLPGRRVITVEHAVPVTPQPSQRPSLCFVGSAYEANVHSAWSFITESWPTIRSSCPAATLELVGGVCHAERIKAAAALDERIVLRGVVPNITDIYAGPAAVICPLWVGSGLKIKVVEALAHGKATIASPIAAQGLEEGINAGFLQAKSPADFLEPAVRLLTDATYRAHWEQAATRFAARFQPQVVFEELDGLLFGHAVTPIARAA